VRWRDHAGAHRSRSFRTKEDAEDFENEVYRRKRMGFIAPLDAGTELVCDWGVHCFETYYKPRLAPATLKTYAAVWDKHVLPCLGGYQLRELTPAIVAQWRTDRHDSGAGDSVLRSAMIVLQGMLKYAVQEGKTSTNVVRVVDKPRQEQPDWPEPVPPLIVEKIRATLQPRDAMLVSLLAYAGLRPQEALAVRWEHWSRGKLRVYAPKTRRTRAIDVVEPLREDLAAYASRTSGQGEIIRFADGRPFGDTGWRNWRARVWKDAAEQFLEGDMRPYRLRGSFASLLVWEGRPITYVAAQLGHSIQTCGRYYLGVFRPRPANLRGRPDPRRPRAPRCTRHVRGTRRHRVPLMYAPGGLEGA
jgi:integrase